MDKRLFLMGIMAAGMCLQSAAGAVILDGGFESQAASVGNYCYFGLSTPGGPPCPTGPWTGVGGAGFQHETNHDWPGVPTSDGSKYAFVANVGSLSQSFTASDGGSFLLSWMDAGRPLNPGAGADGNQSYNLLLNDLLLGTFATTSNQPFTTRSTIPFALVAGQSYTVTFKGLTTYPQSDSTAFIDKVALVSGPAPVPEPTTWTMMIVGFGAVGYSLRRRRGGMRLPQAV